MKDLLGDEIKPEKVSTAKRKPTVRKGYASTPGTGPEGETCGTCDHARKCGNYGCSKSWHKCILMRKHWTGGQGTDILVKSPACRYWEKEKKDE